MMLRLARDDGIFAGISTGANVIGAQRLAGRLGPDAVIVTLAVDTAFKYMSMSPLADLEPGATPRRGARAIVRTRVIGHRTRIDCPNPRQTTANCDDRAHAHGWAEPADSQRFRSSFGKECAMTENRGVPVRVRVSPLRNPA
jgi:hypothetical protein